MNIEKDIQELNEEVKCTIAPSKIHGVGVFALRDIKKGERLYTRLHDFRLYEIPYEKLDLLRPEIRQIIVERWPIVINGFSFEHPNNMNLMSFMNHSDEPNSKYDHTLKDIKKDEEVTEDYRVVPNAEKIFKFL